MVPSQDSPGGSSCQQCTHSASRRNIMRSGHTHTVSTPTDTLLRHVWHSRRAQQHVLWIPGAFFGLINRGSLGITGMVGSGLLKTGRCDFRTGERPLVARRRVVLRSWGVATPTASTSSVRDTPSRLFSTTQPRLDTVSVGSCLGADYYQRVELLSRHTWGGVLTLTAGAPCGRSAVPGLAGYIL
jgi:hypothetical protein